MSTVKFGSQLIKHDKAVPQRIVLKNLNNPLVILHYKTTTEPTTRQPMHFHFCLSHMEKCCLLLVICDTDVCTKDSSGSCDVIYLWQFLFVFVCVNWTPLFVWRSVCYTCVYIFTWILILFLFCLEHNMGRKKKKQSKPWCWYPLLSKKKPKNCTNVTFIRKDH